LPVEEENAATTVHAAAAIVIPKNAEGAATAVHAAAIVIPKNAEDASGIITSNTDVALENTAVAAVVGKLIIDKFVFNTNLIAQIFYNLIFIPFCRLTAAHHLLNHTTPFFCQFIIIQISRMLIFPLLQMLNLFY
jgi:hypothetical protein